MRLLITVPAIGSVYGGPSKTVIDTAKCLHDQGVLVDIVTTNANGLVSSDVPLQQWIPQEGYRIQYFPYIRIGDYKWSSTFASWMFQHVTNYDLVHSNAIFSLPNVPVHWACQRHKVPYVMTPHGMLEPWALSYKAWKKKIYYKLLERPALNKASAIQTLASPENEHIRKLHLTSPMVIVPNGIHRQDFESLPLPELFYQKFPHVYGQKIVLFLGRIDPKKGLDLLAIAFAKVQEQFPNTHLVIAGPNNIGFLSTAQAYFENADCSEAITFTGMLSGELKQSALAAADIYVAPSYSEGFSMSILEGMASGLPCVITSGCNFPEAAKAKVAHVVEINSDDIANGLLKCLKDPSATKVMGSRARQFIFEHYTWDSIAKNLFQVYQTILRQEPVSQEIFTSSLTQSSV